MKNLLIKIPGGYQIGRFEFYKINPGYTMFKQRLSYLGIRKENCGCLFLDLYFVGATFLNRECTP